jgi:hypothetical protein
VWGIDLADATSDMTVTDPVTTSTTMDNSTAGRFGTQIVIYHNNAIVSDPSADQGVGVIYNWSNAASWSSTVNSTVSTLWRFDPLAWSSIEDDTDYNLGHCLVVYGDVMVMMGSSQGGTRSSMVVIHLLTTDADTTYGWHEADQVTLPIVGSACNLALWEHRLIVALSDGIHEYTPQSTCCELNDRLLWTWANMAVDTLDELQLVMQPGLLLLYSPMDHTLLRWRASSPSAEWELEDPLSLPINIVAVALVPNYMVVFNSLSMIVVWDTIFWVVVDYQLKVNQLSIWPPVVRLVADIDDLTLRVAWLTDNETSNGETVGAVDYAIFNVSTLKSPPPLDDTDSTNGADAIEVLLLGVLLALGSILVSFGAFTIYQKVKNANTAASPMR